MLINIDKGRDVITNIEGQAHIIISLDANGAARLQAFSFGDFDCIFCRMDDQRLMQRELPHLLAELRMQIELGRHLTHEESAALKKQASVQASSGSATTE